MANKSGVAVVLMSLVLGGGLGATVGGCGEDRGSVDVEGGTTGGTTATTSTTGTTGTTGTTSTTETTTTGSGY
jgi:hypothetical protein